MSNPSEEFFADTSRDEDSLLTDLKTMLKQHAYAHPRHHQVALGPSQLGHPCARNVISGLIGGGKNSGSPTVNPQFDPLPSYIGVATHKALEDAAALDNKLLYEEFCAEHDGDMSAFGSYRWPRWLTERKVTVTEGLSGTCDLYDTWTDTVIDYKAPGTTKMTEYRKNGPNVLYRVQAHLYGKGYRNEGYPVKRVGIWFLPRSGTLTTSLLWTEDYNEDLVQQQISRLEDMIVLLNDLELEKHPERLAMVPITPYQCTWCPYFSVNPQRLQDNPFACRGGDEYQPPITNHSGMRPIS